MSDLQKFIEERTDAIEFFEGPYTHDPQPETISWDLFHPVLNPNGSARWWINTLKSWNPDKIRESDLLCMEERLIHPTVAMQIIEGIMWEISGEMARLSVDLVVTKLNLLKNGKIED
jgi:hypothetical protein